MSDRIDDRIPGRQGGTQRMAGGQRQGQASDAQRPGAQGVDTQRRVAVGMPERAAVPGAGAALGSVTAGAVGTAGASRNSAVTDSDKKRRGPVIAVICVVVAAIVALCVWFFATGGNDIFDTSAQEGQAPYKSEAEIQEELNRVVDEGMFNISIASIITFDDGQTPGIAYIENVPGNRYNMQVEIVDNEDPSRVYYRSGVIKPNQYIESITLLDDLDAGSYDATANFTALDPDSNEKVGEAAALVTLEVKE